MRWLLLILLFSCTPQKRLHRLLEKHPELVKTKVDTIYINEVKYDTIFRQSKDTVIIHKDKLTMKYFYNNTDSLVYLAGMCDKDTIIIEKQIVTANKDSDFSLGLIGWLLLIALICLLVYLIKK